MSIRWVVLCALGEGLGIAAAVLWYGAVMLTLGEPEPLGARLAVWGLVALAAVPEALVLGGFQAWGLKPAVPDLRVGRWIAATVVPGLIGWGAGGFVPLFVAGPSDGPAVAVEPPLAAILLYAAAFGALAGLLFGACQSLALPRGRRDRLAWIAANAAGWVVALPLIYLGATIGADTESLPLRVLAWAGGGLAAGAVIGLATLPAVRSFARARGGAVARTLPQGPRLG